MPVKVAMPAVAEKVPVTPNEVEMEKLEAVVMLPVRSSELKPMLPAPLIVFEVPDIVTVPLVPEKEPETIRLLLIEKEIPEVTEPLIVRLSKMMFVPLIVLEAPVIVSKPVVCVKVPAPLVAIFPDTLIVADEAVIPERRKLILLKFCRPAPLMVVKGPSNETVLVLPVNVPLFTKFPLTVCELLLPSKVVDAPTFTFPFIVIFEAAIQDTEVPEPTVLVKFPSIVKAVPGIVFVTAPDELLSVR